MTYRKIINRMEKAKRRHGEAMTSIADACDIGKPGRVIDNGIHNAGVEAYNIHCGIWNKLSRYITSLKMKSK